LGVTGAASAIVFNAGYLLLFNIGVVDALSLHDALYWIALASFTGNLVLMAAVRRQWKWEPLCGWFLLAMLPTVALFTLLLPALDTQILLALLLPALVVSGFILGIQGLRERLAPDAAKIVAVPSGVVSGCLAGLFGMGGPVAFLLIANTTSDPSVFRNRILTIGLASSALRVVLLVAAGALTTQLAVVFGATLPFIVAGIVLGHRTHPFLSARSFRLLLAGLVIVAGASTVLEGRLQ
jgi:uncharacterized membrane protein YfcA